MSSGAAPKYWEKTRPNNLVRHTNGRYYARLCLNGKEKWQSLKTSHFSVAEAMLAELQKEHREHRDKEPDPGNAKMTFGQAANVHMRQLEERVTIKRRTKKYWRETLEALYRSWPELPEKEIRRMTPEACRDWANRYARIASDNPRYCSGTCGLAFRFLAGLEDLIDIVSFPYRLPAITARGNTDAERRTHVYGLRRGTDA